MVQPVILRKPVGAEEPAALAEDLAVSRPVGRRAAPRLRLAIPARVIHTGATENCVLLDLSRCGARVGLQQPLAPGACLFLRVAGFELFAEVVRCEPGEGGGVNGLVFDEPLAAEAVLAVRHFAETFEKRERDTLRDQVRGWVAGRNRL